VTVTVTVRGPTGTSAKSPPWAQPESENDAQAQASRVARRRTLRGRDLPSRSTGRRSAKTAAKERSFVGADRAALLLAMEICTGVLTELAPLMDVGALTLQVTKETEDWQDVWMAPEKPESGVRMRFADWVEPGAALSDEGLNVAVSGGVTVRVCGVEEVAPKRPVGT